MADLSQEELVTYIDAATTFFETVAGKLPTPKQVQALLAIASIHETLERIKQNVDIVLELRRIEGRDEPPPGDDIESRER